MLDVVLEYSAKIWDIYGNVITAAILTGIGTELGKCAFQRIKDVIKVLKNTGQVVAKESGFIAKKIGEHVLCFFGAKDIASVKTWQDKNKKVVTLAIKGVAAKDLFSAFWDEKFLTVFALVGGVFGALAGAAGGGAVGAGIGSLFPGIGTGVGATIGAVAGAAILGYLGAFYGLTTGAVVVGVSLLMIYYTKVGPGGTLYVLV